MRATKFLALAAVAVIAISACGTATTPSPSATTGPEPTDGTTPTDAPSGPNAELTAALAGDYDGETVDVFAQWIDAEGVAFDESLDALREATGINVVYSGITNYETVLGARVEGGLAPDIAQIAQAGTMKKYAEDGKLIDLETVLDVEQVRADYSPGFIDASSFDGKIYGLFYKQDLKSIVWYPVEAFETAGYEIPETWDDLVALSDQIVADGSNPWCTTMEHGDATGWVATDWIEDVLLRTAPPETYDQWVTHEIPFNDPAVVHAADLVGQMFFTEGYTYGGSTRINGTWVGDSQTPMFDAAGPKCWLHKQAAWIPDFWPEGMEPEVDSKFFYFPPIDPEFGNPVLGGSDQFMMFNDRPEVRALMQWFSTVDSVTERVATGGFLAASNAVPLDLYTSYPMSGLAEIAQNATVSRADASDSMLKDVGQGTFWKGMVKWVSQNGEGTQAIFDEIEASWP
jgi:alpha-glucoside transport system substrate-binding protein